MTLAHGIGGRLDLPVPPLYFLLAAVTVLVVTFALLSARWTEPRLQQAAGRETAAVGWLRPLGGFASAVAVLMLIVLVSAGLVGSDDPLVNPAPTMVYVGLWLVVPFLSALVGDFYQVIAPWRALCRWLGIGKAERPVLAHRMGYRPAAGVLLAFSWWELVSPVGTDPAWLARLAVAYTVYMLACARWLGVRSSSATMDGFGAYSHLMGAMGPLGVNREGVLVRRGWLRGLTAVRERTGLDALAGVLIGGVTYDGLTGIPFWRNQLAGPLEDTLVEFGLAWEWAAPVVGTFGLISTVLLIGWAYHLACAAVVSLAGVPTTPARVRMRFAHSLAPIALAYAFAHYFTLILYEGQFFWVAIGDPFDRGWDLFGLARRTVDYTLISPTAIWYIQLAAVVGGHVGGVILAHDRALRDFPGPDAVRSQYPMLGLMVLLTMVALLILTSG